jgi:hypothetical protein
MRRQKGTHPTPSVLLFDAQKQIGLLYFLSPEDLYCGPPFPQYRRSAPSIDVWSPVTERIRGLVAAFSTEAGRLASDLEDRAAQGQLEEAHTLAARLDRMTDELLRLASGLSLDALRQTEPTTASIPTAG